MALDLLELLNAIVERDQGPPGLEGTICIGVRSDATERWWRADFGREMHTGFSDERPQIFDAALLVGEREAGAILFDDPLPDPPRLLQLSGDRAMFGRFLDRYFTQSTMLDVRAQHAPRAKKRKARR